MTDPYVRVTLDLDQLANDLSEDQLTYLCEKHMRDNFEPDALIAWATKIADENRAHEARHAAALHMRDRAMMLKKYKANAEHAAVIAGDARRYYMLGNLRDAVIMQEEAADKYDIANIYRNAIIKLDAGDAYVWQPALDATPRH